MSAFWDRAFWLSPRLAMHICMFLLTVLTAAPFRAFPNDASTLQMELTKDKISFSMIANRQLIAILLHERG